MLLSKSSEAVAADIKARYGYKVDGSIIRKLNSGAQKASRVVGYLCRTYDWALPSEANATTDDLGEVNSAMAELRRTDPDRYSKLRLAVLKERDSARAFHDINRGTPGNNNK